MFVIYEVDFKSEERYKKVMEVKTLEEAGAFLEEHRKDDKTYTVVLEP